MGYRKKKEQCLYQLIKLGNLKKKIFLLQKKIEKNDHLKIIQSNNNESELFKLCFQD